ncbi:hypothetical protein [Paenibacillus thiaminolyticus]|uniref:hypothetical protein n=1 Tax=Paenibacillus thiaminolyticus TaxID=49283 RepID=UPI001F0CE1B2|nr:hypothetical protein [Paenibacillus thiaminolyticus]MDG0872234.1 hypothetical protein [Paenibacillus thiaminolyticus]
MQKHSKEIIELMKRVLEEDPFNLVIGDIREELEPVSTVKNDVLQDYENFLNE